MIGWIYLLLFHRYDDIKDQFRIPDMRERVISKESLFRTSLSTVQKPGHSKLQDVTEAGVLWLKKRNVSKLKLVHLQDSSDSQSIHSSPSFISAVSSQEDLTMVNLHMQVNKPIVESPLLMSSYVNHLSQVQKNNDPIPMAIFKCVNAGPVPSMVSVILTSRL
jgi:hypothetical protein